MTYNYARPVTQPVQPPANRPYQKVMYGAPQYYYQAAPQPPMYPAGQPIIYQAPQQYQMMQYMPQTGQPAQAVYLPEDVYAQQIPMQMPPIAQQPQQIRYVQPQQPVQPVEAPQPTAVIDTRRKKKDAPASPQYVPQPPQQTYVQPKKAVPAPPAQPYVQATPVQQQTPPQATPEAESLQSLEHCLPKVPGSILSKEFTMPPGCFNIIRRGNLPGLAFSQIY